MKLALVTLCSMVAYPAIIVPILEENHERFLKVPHYGTICIDNPEHCDFTWDENIPMIDRFPKDMVLSIDYFEAVSQTFSFNQA